MIRIIKSILYLLYFSIFSILNYAGEFPPLNLKPTYSNAERLGIINNLNLERKLFNLQPIYSQHRSLTSTRNELTKSDAAHLLRRTTFGPTLEEIEIISGMETDDALNLLFSNSENPIPDFQWIYHTESPDFNLLSVAQKDSIRDGWEDNFEDLSSWWVNLMNNTGLNIREMMVLFWHDHFATSAQVVKFTPSMYMQNQLFRKFATGNFKNLVKSMNYDSAMLKWLDNDQNYFVSENNFTFNENYARELLELFTMGEGNYSQFDIEEAARALTGLSTDGMYSFYSPTRHDHGNKLFLGVDGDIGVDDIIDIIFEQPDPALFICRKLYQWFVYEIPDDEIVQEMSGILVENNYEIEPVLRSLFSSEHFYDDNFRGAKYKNPVLFTLGTMRQLYIEEDINISFIKWYNWVLGQALFHPPDVSGWDGYRSWVNTYTLPYRKLFTNQIVDGYDNQILPWDNVIEFAERFSDPNNPELLIDEMTEYFFAIQPSELTIDLLLEELLDGSALYDWYIYNPGSNQRIKDVIKHMMRLEEFQLR